jgi:hypothetical protein
MLGRRFLRAFASYITRSTKIKYVFIAIVTKLKDQRHKTFGDDKFIIPNQTTFYIILFTYQTKIISKQRRSNQLKFTRLPH